MFDDNEQRIEVGTKPDQFGHVVVVALSQKIHFPQALLGIEVGLGEEGFDDDQIAGSPEVRSRQEDVPVMASPWRRIYCWRSLLFYEVIGLILEEGMHVNLLFNCLCFCDSDGTEQIDLFWTKNLILAL